MVSTPILVPSGSISIKSGLDLEINNLQDLHFKQLFPSLVFWHKTVAAKILATVLFPMPFGPTNALACPIL
jgi:hypothetical protein